MLARDERMCEAGVDSNGPLASSGIYAYLSPQISATGTAAHWPHSAYQPESGPAAFPMQRGSVFTQRESVSTRLRH